MGDWLRNNKKMRIGEVARQMEKKTGESRIMGDVEDGF